MINNLVKDITAVGLIKNLRRLELDIEQALKIMFWGTK